MNRKSLFWFRQDLRLEDNPGLHQAVQHGDLMPVYIFDDDSMGSASRWWLHHSLMKLSESLGNNLNVYRGNSIEAARLEWSSVAPVYILIKRLLSILVNVLNINTAFIKVI